MFGTVGIIGMGDMGHAVARALRERGVRAMTALEGRSARSRKLAAQSGAEDVGGLRELVGGAELILSIVPPAEATGIARQVAQAIRETGKRPHFVDCNAVSPTTAKEIARAIEAARAPFTDGGIVGAAPRPGGPATRFYVSGPHAEGLAPLDGPNLRILPLGGEIGRASAMKMAYAAINKGALGLYAASLIVAERLGLTAELMRELEQSQKAVHDRIRGSVPWLATDAARWIAEMEEIAATFTSVGVTPRYHEGARDVYRLLASTPLAAEKRETADRTRSLEASLRTFAAAASGR